MWADVLTKPLQGPKFWLMRAFLMNCPVDYYKDNSFEPVSDPMLAPFPATTTHSHEPILDPSPEPTNIPIPMTHRSLHLNVSLQKCVETRSHGTKVPITRRTISETPKKEVSWRDSLFPRHLTRGMLYGTVMISANFFYDIIFLLKRII